MVLLRHPASNLQRDIRVLGAVGRDEDAVEQLRRFQGGAMPV